MKQKFCCHLSSNNSISLTFSCFHATTQLLGELERWLGVRGVGFQNSAVKRLGTGVRILEFKIQIVPFIICNLEQVVESL